MKTNDATTHSVRQRPVCLWLNFNYFYFWELKFCCFWTGSDLQEKQGTVKDSNKKKGRISNVLLAFGAFCSHVKVVCCVYRSRGSRCFQITQRTVLWREKIIFLVYNVEQRETAIVLVKLYE